MSECDPINNKANLVFKKRNASLPKQANKCLPNKQILS